MGMIGKEVLNAVAELTVGPQSSAMSVIAKPIIRMPETVEEAKALKVWADAQSDGVPAASTQQIAKHLDFLAATLPSKGVDEDTARMRFAVYSRILGEYSNAALAYMARKACATLDWFPTPKQCLELLNEYRAPTSEKDHALMLCHSFWEGRFQDFIGALKDGNADQVLVDSVPEQWRRIAVERGFLRYMPEENRFVIRQPKPDAVEAEV